MIRTWISVVVTLVGLTAAAPLASAQVTHSCLLFPIFEDDPAAQTWVFYCDGCNGGGQQCTVLEANLYVATLDAYPWPYQYCSGDCAQINIAPPGPKGKGPAGRAAAPLRGYPPGLKDPNTHKIRLTKTAHKEVELAQHHPQAPEWVKAALDPNQPAVFTYYSVSAIVSRTRPVPRPSLPAIVWRYVGLQVDVGDIPNGVTPATVTLGDPTGRDDVYTGRFPVANGAYTRPIMLVQRR